eukprot:CAMPEP_0181121168 /NCGR_PEP_ID=MMETSP1071-20121207/24584_1 /TAXON_ID=35127 /ORGANISM="Thalassiosira sp., Strain NH16" /LENGTH=410 /DNA_ID=CAMNT_0023205949 /DNA_START=114 /DNA_END=1346 /DNA_ORIENTATION=-
MARRLLGVGLRRPAPSSACMMSPLMENLSMQSQTAMPRQPLVLPCNRTFSSVSTKKYDRKSTVVELPPNLKIDPRAKSSPFYGAEIVKPKKLKLKKKQKKKMKEEHFEAVSDADLDQPEDEKAGDGDIEASSEIVDGEEYDDEYEDYDSEDEEEERILYDLSTKPDVPRAIPLPKRLHVPVVDIKTGEDVGTFHLSEKTFGNDPVRVDILHRVVVYQRNKKRGKRNAGARTKTISEKRGSTRKVRPQKGGGQARAGHSRPAHWRGGAKAHGPKGRIQDYTTKLNKKVRKMGVRHALSQKLLEGNLIVTSDLAIPTHKTSALDVMLNRFDISGREGVNALIIDDADLDDAENEASVYGGLDVNFKVASGNLHKVKMLNQLGCNVYDMMKFKKLVLSLAAVRSLEERLERDL